MTIGIYKIENKVNSKLYIGSSKNIENRWKQHQCLLRIGKHHSQHLQYSWNKYGCDMFEFTIIEDNILQDDLLVREQYWMDKFQSYNPRKGYNMSIVAGAYVMNDNYNFEEIVDEEYELENKYKTIYLIMNMKDKDLVYQKLNLFKNICTFNDFIFAMYKYLVDINFNTWVQITLFTDEYQINLHNLWELPNNVCEDIIYKHDYKKILIDDSRLCFKEVFYKDYFKWFKTKIDEEDSSLKFLVFDGFDITEFYICTN